MCVHELSDDEFELAVGKAKRNKASGIDDIPAEFWKTLVEDPEARSCLLDICNLAWSSKEIPADWRHADVVVYNI